MTNTIPNVPRELLADLLGNDHDKRIMAERHLLAMLANAPSPAGVDGLNTDRNAAFKACPESGCDWGSFYLGWKARGEVEQAIIDGLRGEVAQLQSMLATVSKAGIRVRTDRDQQAQRIGELEGLLREWRRMFDGGLESGQLGVLRGHTDAALSAGKEGE